MILAGSPSVIVLAGPNGAGKSTTAPMLLKGRLRVTEFVNADLIARGLSPFDPEGAALPAGKIMLKRIRELALRRVSFAFETTLATRSFQPWLSNLINMGYRCRLIYLWLPNPDMAVARVRERVASGGHDVPEETVRRRYERGLQNFFELYRPLAIEWRVYDSSSLQGPRLVVSGIKTDKIQIVDHNSWNRIRLGHEK